VIPTTQVGFFHFFYSRFSSLSLLFYPVTRLCPFPLLPSLCYRPPSFLAYIHPPCSQPTYALPSPRAAAPRRPPPAPSPHPHPPSNVATTSPATTSAARRASKPPTLSPHRSPRHETVTALTAFARSRHRTTRASHYDPNSRGPDVLHDCRPPAPVFPTLSYAYPSTPAHTQDMARTVDRRASMSASLVAVAHVVSAALHTSTVLARRLSMSRRQHDLPHAQHPPRLFPISYDLPRHERLPRHSPGA
jgi:hypothetical protein